MRLIIKGLLAPFALGLALGCSPDTQPTSNAKKEEAPPTAASPRVVPKMHRGEGWALAAPADWNALADPPAPTVLYLSGDGRAGIPLFDGTLAPLKAGLLVEVFPPGETSLKARAESDAEELNGSEEFRVRQGPDIEEIELADGTAALLFQAEFDRLENRRLSIYQKVYCSDRGGRHIVATGFITCGRAGGPFVKAIALADFVRAHLISLVLDPDKLDRQKLQGAYEKHDWQVGAALRKVELGNRLIEKEDHAEAVKTFRNALAICKHISAAHNGLAWSLLHVKEPGRRNLDEALRHAKTAVEQTEELDAAALDTLALALHRGGDKKQAMKAIRKAIRIQPNEPELQRRLKSFEKDG